jgi:hypothetical protein
MVVLPMSAAALIANVVHVVLAITTLRLLTDPIFVHEVDGLPAGRIPTAVATPVGLMCRWHIQVDRLLVHSHRHRRDHDRLRVDDYRWRHVADADASIDPGWLMPIETPTFVPAKAQDKVALASVTARVRRFTDLLLLIPEPYRTACSQ